MKQKLIVHNSVDDNGKPAGGSIYATGLRINWQDGPLRDVCNDTRVPNGCFVETVIAAAISRLEYYQRSEFKNPWNAEAIVHLQAALATCEARTADREARGVEGTYTV